MTTYRKSQFRGERAQDRAGEGLLQVDGDALCWITVQEYEKLAVEVYPAVLQTQPIAVGRGDKFPVFCETSSAPGTETLIIPSDPKTIGMDACVVLEGKSGGDRDAEARVIQMWDNDGTPLLDVSQVDAAFDCNKRFVRLRGSRVGAPVFAGMKVLRGPDTQ